MEVQNNKTENPIRIYKEQFEKMDPESMSKKSGVPFDGEKFTISYLGRTVTLTFPDMETAYEDGSKLGDYVKILLARFVMTGVSAPSTGKFLSYQEVPWGETYLDAFRRRCINRFSGTYGYNTEGFVKACETLKAKKITGADFAYEIEFLPGFFVRLLLWAPDEEFGPTSQILFSDNFPLAFTAEDLAVVGDVVMNALKNRW